MLKKWKRLCAAICVLAMVVNCIAGSGVLTTKAAVTTSYDTEITAFGDPDTANRQGGWLWFTLSNQDYTNATVAVNETQWQALKTSNWDSKIKFTDSEGVEHTLAEYNLISVYQHLWGRGGQPLALQIALDYSTLQSITVEAGCQFPAQATCNETENYAVYETQTTVTFVNDGTGAFTKVVPNTYKDTTVTAFGDPGADGSTDSKSQLWFSLSAHDYTEYSQNVTNDQFNSLNWKEKITFKLSDGTQKKLGDYTINQVRTYLWARANNPVAIEIAGFDYTAIQEITISEGCEFPSQATANQTSGLTLYKTTESITFMNDGTGAFYKYVPNEYIDTTVTSFGDPGFTADASEPNLWFTLSASDYADATAGNAEVIAGQITKLNWTEKIKITVDGVEKSLGEYTIEAAYINKWVRAGAPIAIQIANFDYTQIDSITIKAGCEFPSQSTASATSGLTIYRTTEDVTFVNNGTGAFSKYEPNEYVDTTVTSFGDPGFAEGSSEPNLWFTLSASDYADATAGNAEVIAGQITKLNWTEKIKITVDGVEKSLGEYTIEAAYINKWVRAGAPIAIQIANFDYTTIDKITIVAGCEFPSYATKDAASGLTVYVTTESVTFVNDGDGNFVLPNEYLDTTVTAFGDPNPPTEGGTHYESNLWFTLSENDYADADPNTPVSAEQITKLNWTEKISFTIDGVEKSLSEYTIETVFIKKWDRAGAPIAIQIANFDYTTIDKITIEEGCEFPSYATKDATNPLLLYRTIETITLVNDGNGNFGLDDNLCETHDYEDGYCTVCGLPEGMTYTIDAHGKMAVTGYEGELKDLVLPVKVGTYSITKINTNAFIGSGLESISIPSYVLTIGDNAFAEGVNVYCWDYSDASNYTSAKTLNRYCGGDVNAVVTDGGAEIVNSADLVRLKKNGTTEQKAASDVNLDGIVDEKDLHSLRMILLDEFEAEVYQQDELHYQSSNYELAYFLNDFAHRSLRYDEFANGKFAVGDGTGFQKNWDAMGLTWHNATEEALGVNKLDAIYGYLSSIDQDDLGMIYNTPNAFENPTLEIAGGAAIPQGWQFPTWYYSSESYDDWGVESALGSTAFEFNQAVTNKNSQSSIKWQNRLYTTWIGIQRYNGWKVDNGTIDFDGSGYMNFSTYSLSTNETFTFYFDNLDDHLEECGGIKTVFSPFVEMTLHFNATNLEDYYLIWETSDGNEYEVAHNAVATTQNSGFADYNDRTYLSMYLNENWDNKTITKIGVRFKPVSGTTLSVTNGKIDYIRCQYDTRQSNATLQWLLALSNYVDYTNDIDRLANLMPKAREALLFLTDVLEGKDGLLDISYLYGHNGSGITFDENGNVVLDVANGVSNGYWDLTVHSEVGLDANIYFYQVLQAMAKMEQRLEDAGKTVSDNSTIRYIQKSGAETTVTYGYTADSLATLAATVKANIEKDINPVKQSDGTYANEGGFWNSTTGRFASGINEETGAIADYGYVYLNLELICAGIGTDEQQLSIMQWIDGERTVDGDNSTGEDIYFYEFAPRTNTKDAIENLSAFSYLVIKPLVETYGYENTFSRQLQNGGAAIAWSYYDLVARAKVLGADNAYKRLQEIQSWYEKVKAQAGAGYDFYSGYYDALEAESGKGLYVLQQSPTAGPIGLDAEFIESVILIKAIPEAFFGMESEGNNSITFTNNLPSALDTFQMDNLRFDGATYSLKGTENSLEILNVGGITNGLKTTLRLKAPDKTSYTVYVNDVKVDDTEYVVEDGYIIVTVDFDNVKVIVK